MTIRDFLITGFHDIRGAVQQHRLLTLAFIVLFAVGGSSRFLRGQLIGNDAPDTGTVSRETESLRTCHSKGTIFEGIDNFEEVTSMYRRAMSAVVGEREHILSTPSEWKCGAGTDGEPAMPALQSLANGLPGWQYRADVSYLFGSITTTIVRPVTFATFASIVAEFQREYECKLTEIQDRSVISVVQNYDIPTSAQYCCIAADGISGCRQQTDDSQCISPLSSDPLCGGQCTGLMYMSDIAYRAPRLIAATQEERRISRLAVERTLATLRSFEMNYATARQLICYQRASLDLKNEMSLLADAVSCMPKIWDATTSIHDRKEP